MLKQIEPVSGFAGGAAPPSSAPAESEGMVLLGDAQPLAGGAQQNVFAHPGDSRLLIKVARDRSEFPNPWYKRRATRSGAFRPALIEIEEYAALAARAPGDLDLIERVHGVVRTDLGLGLVVEALRGEDGGLAPTLYSVVRKGRFDAGLQNEVETFIARVLASHLIAYDMKLTNIVHAFDPATGTRRLVLVDGVGERMTIPFNKMSRRLNRYNKGRRIARLRAEIARVLTYPRSS